MTEAPETPEDLPEDPIIPGWDGAEIRAERIVGGSFEGETFTGGRFVGGSLETARTGNESIVINNDAFSGFPGVVFNPEWPGQKRPAVVTAYAPDDPGSNWVAGSVAMVSALTDAPGESRVNVRPDYARLAFIDDDTATKHTLVAASGDAAQLFRNPGNGAYSVVQATDVDTQMAHRSSPKDAARIGTTDYEAYLVKETAGRPAVRVRATKDGLLLVGLGSTDLPPNVHVTEEGWALRSTVDYEDRIAALEQRIAALESRLT